MNIRADSIVWSGQDFWLRDFVQSFPLPQIIKVEEGYDDEFEEDRTLSSSQLLTLHSLKELTTVKATEGSLEVLLPTDSKSKVTIVRGESDGPDYYDSVEELANGFPHFVAVENCYTCYKIAANEVLELKKKVKKHRANHLACNIVNTSQIVELPFSFKARFKVLGSCPVVSPTLEDVIKHCKLPCEVRFIDNTLKLVRDGYNFDRPYSFNTLGTFTLHSVNHYKVVFTTTWEDQKASAVLPLPLDLEIRVVAALGAIRNDKNYSKLCKIAQDKTKSEQLVLKSIRHGPCKVLLEDTKEPENDDSDYSEVGPQLPQRNYKAGSKQALPVPKQRSISSPAVPDRKALPIPTPELKDNVFEEGYISVEESGRKRSISVNFPKNWDVDTSEHDDTASSPSPSASNPRTFLTDSRKRIEKLLSPLKKVPSKVGSGVKKRDLKQSATCKPSASSSSTVDDQAEYREVTPLPSTMCNSADRINIELLTRLDIKSEKNPNDICNIRNPDDMTTWTMEEVAECLRFCHLERYVETFKEERIDGNLLADLDAESLSSLGVVDALHRRKLTKIIGGWLPKT